MTQRPLTDQERKYWLELADYATVTAGEPTKPAKLMHALATWISKNVRVPHDREDPASRPYRALAGIASSWKSMDTATRRANAEPLLDAARKVRLDLTGATPPSPPGVAIRAPRRGFFGDTDQEDAA